MHASACGLLACCLSRYPDALRKGEGDSPGSIQCSHLTLNPLTKPFKTLLKTLKKTKNLKSMQGALCSHLIASPLVLLQVRKGDRLFDAQKLGQHLKDFLPVPGCVVACSQPKAPLLYQLATSDKLSSSPWSA